jgi:peptidyl-prolyl cis-trans isomerase C
LKNSYQIITLFCFVIGLFIYPACAVAEDPSKTAEQPVVEQTSESENTVVAKVNGKEIKNSELTQALNTVVAQNPQLRAAMSSEDQMKEFKTQVLQQLVSTELLTQEGKKLKINDLDQQVDETYKNVKANFPNEEDFQKSLEIQNMTEEDLRIEIEKGVRIQNLIDQNVQKDISIPEKDAKAFYDTNKDKFVEKESVKASHILIQVEKDAEKEKDKEAREKIDGLLKRAKKGEDFAALAKENSEDPSAERNSGDLGYFSKGQMVPEFEDAAFALKVGDISDVVKSSFGYHIIKCEDKKPERTVPYEEAQERITQYLENTAVQAKLTEYLETLKQAGNVEILLK